MAQFNQRNRKGGVVMPKVENVQVFNSKINYHNGTDIGAGFAVFFDPPITDKFQIWEIADKIKYALEGLQFKE
jgi:hypothetical protein